MPGHLNVRQVASTLVNIYLHTTRQARGSALREAGLVHWAIDTGRPRGDQQDFTVLLADRHFAIDFVISLASAVPGPIDMQTNKTALGTCFTASFWPLS